MGIIIASRHLSLMPGDISAGSNTSIIPAVINPNICCKGGTLWKVWYESKLCMKDTLNFCSPEEIAPIYTRREKREKKEKKRCVLL